MDFRDLVKVGAHFGHLKSRLDPRMLPYIWGIKNNVYLIDVSKTATLLQKAANFLKDVAAEGKPILWIGTKKAAKDAINETAKKLDMPYVSHRWIGGTLSNYGQVKKSVTKYLHYEDVLAKAEKYPYYTKKELNTIAKNAEKLKKNIGGILNLTWPIGAVVVVDVSKEMSAVKEAATVGIPVVAIVDTNGDPSLADYVIPANDDSVRSIKLIVDYLQEAAQKGKAAAKEAKKVEASTKKTTKASKPAAKTAAKGKEETDKKRAKKPDAKVEAKKTKAKETPKKKTAQSKGDGEAEKTPAKKKTEASASKAKKA